MQETNILPDQQAANREEITALSVARKDGAGDALMSFFGAEIAGRLNNFDGDVKRKWQLMALGQSSDVKQLSEHLDSPIAVRYIACQKVEVNGNAGELIPAIRTVLYDENMERFATVSDGVAASVAEIFGVFGTNPFTPPLTLKAVESKTNRGHKVLKLVPVM